ncbi:unnamed protein product [Gulo gulo]|uniref:Uncharacterized protein n=1 Tax=Gulo gulo TaxID=48420 RepID=A0A9X9Q2J3_GULGU|nr:unnamed protein product [Gulo gulo]
MKTSASWQPHVP